VSHGAVNLAPLLRVIRTPKRLLLLFLRGLLGMISVVSSVLVNASISCVDLTTILLPWGPLAPRFQKLSPSFGGLYEYIGDCEQIGHRLVLLHDELLHSLHIADPVMEGIDDLNVLDVWDSVPGIVEIFHVVSEAFIMLLSDGLQGLCCRRTLVCALKVPNEHGA
jgi:hypothetical protein